MLSAKCYLSILSATMIALVASTSITGSNGVVYQVSLVNDTALDFVVNGPSSLGYAAIGIGNAMAKSLMFVMARLKNPGFIFTYYRFIIRPSSSNTTVSIATASGHVQPTQYGSSSPAIKSISTTSNSSTFSISFVCTACGSWGSESLSTYLTGNKTQLSLIRAEGSLASSQKKRQTVASSSTGIAFHGSNYGIHNVNLNDKTQVISGGQDTSKVWKAHAALVCLGFLGVYAFGIAFAAILTNVADRIKIHYMIQSSGTLLGIVGIALGFKAAGGSIDSVHTRFGVFLFVLIFVQATLGTAQHLLYIKQIVSAPYLIVRLAHRVTGWFFLFGVIINAGLGLKLVGISTGGQIAWYVLLLLCWAGYFAMSMTKRLVHSQATEDRGPDQIEMKGHNGV